MTHKSHIYVSTARGILRTFHVGCNCFVDSIETLLLHENAKQDMGRKRPTDFTCHRARSVDWSVCERSQVIDVTARMPRDSVKFGIRQVSLQLSLLITFLYSRYAFTGLNAFAAHSRSHARLILDLVSILGTHRRLCWNGWSNMHK